MPGDIKVDVTERDNRLWERGDEAAFGELFERHVQSLWNYCYRLTAFGPRPDGPAAPGVR